jgi:hypothetical protein
MECPFCIETVRDEAVACRHCTRDLTLVRPVILEVQEAMIQIGKLQRDRRRISSLLQIKENPVRFFFILGAIYVALPTLALLAVHYLAVFKFDLAQLYIRIAAVLIPLPFGFELSGARNIRFRGALLIGFATAIVCVWSMMAITGLIDDVPVLPSGMVEWKEAAEFCLSIALAFSAGNLLGTILLDVIPLNFSSAGRPSKAAYWLVGLWGQTGSEETRRRRARHLENTAARIGPLVGFLATSIGAVYTGLKGFLLN